MDHMMPTEFWQLNNYNNNIKKKKKTQTLESCIFILIFVQKLKSYRGCKT